LNFPVSHQKRFEARKTGVLVHSLSGKGKVVSVYPKAVNIRCSQGLVVSLIEEAEHMTVLSLHVPAYFRSQGAKTQTGTRVRFEKDRLSFDGFCVGFNQDTPWEAPLAPRDVQGFSLSKRAIFQEALLQQGKRGGLLGLIRPGEEQNVFERKAAGILRRILQQTPDGAYINGLSQLVGLGPGLTPSGDDFIAGLLLGEEILSLLKAPQGKIHSGPIHAVIPLKINKGELWHGLTATNDGGRTLLYQTLLGCFPNYLISVAKNLGNAQAMGDVADAVRRAVSHGETSGTDALVGLLFYLNASANAYEYARIRGEKRTP
jgi:hypothetical protein